MTPPGAVDPDVIALWQRIRDRHKEPRNPGDPLPCRYCVPGHGCWLDDYAAELLAEHTPEAPQ